MVCSMEAGFNFILLTVCVILSHTAVAQNVEVQLTGGSSTFEGTVLIRKRDDATSAWTTWGTVCDDRWDNNDADVVCRMLGYVPPSTAFINSSPFGPGSGGIRLDNVNCIGNEDNLLQCPFFGSWGNHNCKTDHSEDAGVRCSGVLATSVGGPPNYGNCSTNSTVRLVGGPYEGSGRVEILHSGVWGTICDDRWGINNARVICKTLCYGETYAKTLVDRSIAPGNGTIWIDELLCAGSETQIEDCPRSTWGTHDCSHKEDVAVSCLDLPEPKPSDPQPSVTCSAGFVTASFSQSQHPELNTTHLSLTNAGSGCGFTVSQTTASDVSIKIPLNGCNTNKQHNDTHLFYCNEVKYEIPTGNGIITRTHRYDIPVCCVLPRDGDVINSFNPETKTVPPQNADDQFSMEMFMYEDETFTKTMAMPAVLDLGAWLNVGVVLYSEINQVKLIVPDCYASLDSDPSANPQYRLISAKCRQDSTLSFFPMNDTMFAFRFQSFAFVQNLTQVYVHCNAFVCDINEKTANCDRSCQSPKGRRRREAELTPQLQHVENGPIILKEEHLGEGNLGGSSVGAQLSEQRIKYLLCFVSALIFL